MSERISSALCASRHPIQTLEPKPARSFRRLTDYRLDQGFMTRKLDIEIPHHLSLASSIKSSLLCFSHVVHAPNHNHIHSLHSGSDGESCAVHVSATGRKC